MSPRPTRRLLIAPGAVLSLSALFLFLGIAVSHAGAPTEPVATQAAAAPLKVIPRSGWGANESFRFNPSGQEIWPRTFWPVQKIVIHHTETQNYDPDPAGTIRAMYHDDARLRGLGDIAYNFLIDEQGRIYEGRYSRPYLPGESPTGEDTFGNGVAAAHAYGRNSGSVGIALLGSLDDVDPTPRARVALERLVAWIAARHQIDPQGASSYRNPATGERSVFPNVVGHGEINATECPGRTGRAALPGIRVNAASLVAGKAVSPQPNTRPRRRRSRKGSLRRREDRAIAQVLRRRPIVFSGGGRRREVALTFHDGPGPHTMQIVDTLKQLRAPATFFEVGNSIIYFSDEVVAQHRRGFAIGNLTATFASLTRLPSAGQRVEIRTQSARLRSLGISPPKLFSPPYGAYNRKTLAVLRRLGMLMVLWSVDPHDYEQPGVDTIVRRVLRRVKPGSIVLLHDAGGDRTQTVQALPAIVRGLRKRGYRLVTVPRMMLRDPPRT